MAEEQIPVAAEEKPKKEKELSDAQKAEQKLTKAEATALKKKYLSERNLIAAVTHSNKVEDVEKLLKKYQKLVSICLAKLAELKPQKIQALKDKVAALQAEIDELEAPADGEGV